ncbi:hypothetical protein B0T22DRAFT_535683 [Podospora appendiculata]|uniref:Uncharacterized protein n=1 Tax=Podospora appendiculata TaxID=314037 RepID=A0AAE1CCJ8_9PEZI|nr:hypothetical protein B0T22DRAFT_535683 [Podospora appendiculata]
MDGTWTARKMEIEDEDCKRIECTHLPRVTSKVRRGGRFGEMGESRRESLLRWLYRVCPVPQTLLTSPPLLMSYIRPTHLPAINSRPIDNSEKPLPPCNLQRSLAHGQWHVVKAEEKLQWLRLRQERGNSTTLPHYTWKQRDYKRKKKKKKQWAPNNNKNRQLRSHLHTSPLSNPRSDNLFTHLTTTERHIVCLHSRHSSGSDD